MNRLVEWRESKREPVPTGIFVLGATWKHFPYGTNDNPCLVLRDPVSVYWTVHVSHLDGSPTIERLYEPPSIWRFI